MLVRVTTQLRSPASLGGWGCATARWGVGDRAQAPGGGVVGAAGARSSVGEVAEARRPAALNTQASLPAERGQAAGIVGAQVAVLPGRGRSPRRASCPARCGRPDRGQVGEAGRALAVAALVVSHRAVGRRLGRCRWRQVVTTTAAQAPKNRWAGRRRRCWGIALLPAHR